MDIFLSSTIVRPVLQSEKFLSCFLCVCVCVCSRTFSDYPLDVVHTVPYSPSMVDEDTKKKPPPPLSLWMGIVVIIYASSLDIPNP